MINSFTYAWKGLKYVFTHEQNFRFQVVAAAMVVVLMFLLDVQPWEAVALVFVITAVLILEILNSAIEKVIDLLKPRMHHYSGIVKDMMAAAVVLASVGATVVGIIIFLPNILRLFR